MMFLRFLVSLALIFVCFNLSAQVVSDFSTDADGWTTPNDADGTITHSLTGGNPGGQVSGSPFVFVGGSGTTYIPFFFEAPTKFEGNKSTYYGGNLRYDAQLSVTGTPLQAAEVILTNAAGISIYYFPVTPFQPPATTWATFNVPLSSTTGEWKTGNSSTATAATTAQIQAMLGSIQTLQIRGLYRNANVVTRLDNVTMYPPIIVNTQPTPKAVCNGVTTTFTTAASNNPNIGYHWQFLNPAVGYTDITNTGGYSNATTATLSVNTTGNFGAGTYRCRITGTAVDDQVTTAVLLTINALPTAPTTSGSSSCTAAALTLTASGGAAGQYRWYTLPTGGGLIAGQTNATYVTPVISTTTTYYAAINNGTCESTRTAVVATINTPPTAPTVAGGSVCTSGAATLSASGAAAGQYRWYTLPSGGGLIAGQTNATYITPVISTTTTYYASINNGTCESTRAAVVATVSTPPSAPTASGASGCSGQAVTLTASGGAAGQYRWYILPSGGLIAGQTNATYTTPALSTTTTFYVSINDGNCESPVTAVAATIGGAACNNAPPVIDPTSASTTVGSTVTIDVLSLISDSDNNLVLSTLAVVTQPASGAVATIDGNNQLVVDYTGISFTGTETVSIRICDALSACAVRQISIEVVGSIRIFNAVSANKDGKNDVFFIEHIDQLANTKKNHVSIFNRWGDLVWEGNDYNNTTVAFHGLSKNNSELPSGTYYYKIEFTGGKAMESGYLELKR